MDFSTFLSVAQTTDFWSNNRRVCFVGSEYPALFFYFLFTTLKQKNVLPDTYQRLFIETMDRRSMQAALNQSILGMQTFYWMGNVTDEKETKEQQELLALLIAYKGPNGIAFFVDAQTKAVAKKDDSFVYITNELNFATFELLLDFLGEQIDTRRRALLKRLFTSSSSIALDTCCMLMTYIELISAKYIDEYDDYFARLIGSLPTLSQLTELFFAKNTTSFFAVWSKIYSSYPDVFWISFWSEQLWKAHYVALFMKEKNFVAAKRMSFRLPYSFINRDWQKVNAQELINAYSFLYYMDYAFKHGSTFCSLDLFYTNYFTGTFAVAKKMKAHYDTV